MKFMSKKEVKKHKNSEYKALCCIILLGVMILFNSFFVSADTEFILTTDTGWSTESIAECQGVNMTAMNDIKIMNVTKPAGSNPLYAYVIYNNALVDYALFSGDVATFTNNPKITKYGNVSVVTGTNTTSYTDSYKSASHPLGSTSYAITSSRIFYTCGTWGTVVLEQNVYQANIVKIGINNYTTILANSPIINITFPADNYKSTATLINFNVTLSDKNPAGTIKNVTLYIDGILNQTNSTEAINQSYSFSKNMAYGSHLWNIVACNNNSLCTNTTNRTLNVGIYENSRTYDTNITEGAVGTYVLNITTGSYVTSAYLSYNGTLKATNINANPSYTTLTSSFNVPSVSANTNISLFWIVYTPTANWNSTASNQTILNVNIDNCSINKIVLYNFTVKDEVSQLKINGSDGNITGKLNIQVYPFASRSLFFNYSQLTNNTNPFAVCINSTLSSGDKFSIDAQIEYSANGYAKEYYYIQNDTFDINYKNNNISLYDLDNTHAQTFRIIYLDQSGIPIEDAIIEVQRKYVEEDLFKIVEISKTDKDGETQAKLQLNDVIYNFVIKKYGVTLDSFNKKFVRCDNYVYNVCEIKLNSFASYPSTVDYTQGEDFQFTLDYNYSSRTITSTFNIPSGNSSNVVLNATLLDNLGTTLACEDSLLSSTGTLTCIVPNSIGNSSVYVQLYKDGVVQGSGTVKLEQNPRDIFGNNLVFLLIFMYMTIIGLAVSDSPMVTGIFLIIGAVLGIVLNFVKSSGFIGAGATILWLIIAITIVLIKGGKRN